MTTARERALGQARAVPCCDLHNRNCEPPGDLCCGECTEYHHGLHACSNNPMAVSHHDGSTCVLQPQGGGGPSNTPTDPRHPGGT